MIKWYENSSPENDVAISTRIRLARNLYEFPFPDRMSPEDKQKVTDKVISCFKECENNSDYNIVDMKNITNVDLLSLIEKHLISPEFATNTDHRGLIISKDETVSIMINEEDHIRIQVILPGLDVEEAYKKADEIDNMISAKLHFAFNEKLGYLTQCPTNLGTGMRVSAMLHLPCLSMTNYISKLGNTISKLGLTIRGIYGEGSKPIGDFYQVSNQVSLGITEEQAITNLKNIVSQIISQEKKSRQGVKNDLPLCDKISRSYGILTNAKLISGEEFMRLYSLLRLGIETNIIDNVQMRQINSLIVKAQAGNIMKAMGKELPPQQRDYFRSEIIRQSIMGS